MSLQRPLEITAKLLEMRDHARRLCGDNYDATIARFRAFLRGYCRAHGLPIIRGLPALAKQRAEEGKPLDNLGVLWFAAATVEEVEAGQ